MAKLFLDLKKMKKLASDDKTTTFQHIAGHKIVVARRPLSEQARKDMDAIPLAYGGNPKLEQSKKSPPAGKLPGEAEQHSEKGAGGLHVLEDKKKPEKMAYGGNPGVTGAAGMFGPQQPYQPAFQLPAGTNAAMFAGPQQANTRVAGMGRMPERGAPMNYAGPMAAPAPSPGNPVGVNDNPGGAPDPITIRSQSRPMANGGVAHYANGTPDGGAEDKPFTQMPGIGGMIDEGKMPQVGDAGYNSGEAKQDSLGNGVIDTAVTMGIAPLVGAMAKDAGAVLGNEVGSIGSDLGAIQKLAQQHGLDENASIGELLQKASGKKLGEQSQTDMTREMAARSKQLMQQNRTAYTSKLPPKKMADGGDIKIPTLDPSLAMAPGAAPQATQDPNAIDYDNADYANQSAPADAPYGTGAPQAPAPVAAAPAPASQAAEQPPGEKPDPYGVNATAQTFQAGLDQAKQGIFAQQQAESQQAAIQGKALNDAITAQHLQQATYQQHYSDLDKERQNFQADIQNQHIDPQHYMNSLGTGQKLGTALALILGGIGSGGDPSKNPAMQFLQSNIDRDINAQKANLGKSENLLSANMHQFGNMRDAADMTRIQQTDILSNQLKQAAAKATDLGAKARALQAAGQLDMSTAQLQGQMAMRKTILSGMSSGQVQPEQVIRAIVPDKEQEQARKELQTAQKDQALRNDTLKAFDAVNSLSSGVGNAINPQSYKQADAVWGSTMDKLTRDTSGRVTPETVALMSTLRPARTDTASTTAVKRAKLNDILSQNMHYPTLDTYGIKGFSNTADGQPGGAQLRTKTR